MREVRETPTRARSSNRRTRGTALAFAVFFAILAGGVNCAKKPVRPPPDSGGGQQNLAGKIVWHDLVTQDPEVAMHFYGGLLGWRFEKVSESYWIVHNRDRAIAGIGRIHTQGISNQWIPQVAVIDVDRIADGAQASGGTILLGPMELRGRGRAVVLSDPQGAVFGLISAGRDDPTEPTIGNGDWLWHEVWATDPDGVASFYEGLAGYQSATTTLAGAPYRYFQRDGKARFGLLKKPDPKIGAAWVSYLRVDDPAALARRTSELGGTVLFAPRADLRNGSIVIIADPGGAGLVLQKWPMEKG